MRGFGFGFVKDLTFEKEDILLLAKMDGSRRRGIVRRFLLEFR